MQLTNAGWRGVNPLLGSPPQPQALGISLNLDELVNSVRESDLRESLSCWVEEWKQDDKDIEALVSLIIKWHGNVRF